MSQPASRCDENGLTFQEGEAMKESLLDSVFVVEDELSRYL